MMGGAQREENIDLLTPQQQNFLSSVLGGQTGNAQQAYGNLLQDYSPDEFQDFYQKSFIEPAQQNLQRNIIPTIKESFLGMDESGGSSLNRALAQSATDLSSQLGQGMLGQYNQQRQNQMGALQGLGGMMNTRAFEPVMNQQAGLLPGILNAVASGAGGGLAGGAGGALAGILNSFKR